MTINKKSSNAASSFAPYTLIVAEKPSVGRDIARVLKVTERADGYLTGDGYRVTWAIGHLVSLSEPEEIDARYKRWRVDDLPILPERIPLKVLPKTKKQFGIVKRLMNDKGCERIICATDAGREGELIFRYLYQMAACGKPVLRLWISSMTDEAIREGLGKMQPSTAYDSLYESARCRSEADWLVGMNASRAFTLRYDALLSVGRVQTPTLSLLVQRDAEIKAFTPEVYWTVQADFGDYQGLWLDEETKEKKLSSAERADEIVAKVKGAQATVESVTREEKKEWPPYLYDLTSLQRDANRLLSFTAKKTLETAQKLYEERKLLTYPRTDSQHLPRDMATRAQNAIHALPEQYAAHTVPLLAEKLPLPRRVFDDAKVTDHHAIIPTGKRVDLSKLPDDERALFDLVVRRFLSAFYPAHRYGATRVLTRAAGEPFESLGRETLEEGWKAVYSDRPAYKQTARKPKREAEQALPNMVVGDTRAVRKAQARQDKTRPPAPHTDASLLAAMEHAGRDLQDAELRESMKKSGLGTPATRAAIIERLLAVGYAARRGKTLEATEKGIRLIAVTPPDIASPETTGRWEKALSDIAIGEMEPDRFLSGIRRLAAALVESAASAPQDVQFEREEKRRKRGAKAARSLGACPLCGEGRVLENSRAFYCTCFREGCSLTVWKDCCVRYGGPPLTANLMERLLSESSLVGSTGTLTHAKGVVSFAPKRT